MSSYQGNTEHRALAADVPGIRKPLGAGYEPRLKGTGSATALGGLIEQHEAQQWKN